MLSRRGAAVAALMIAAGLAVNAPAFAVTPAGTIYVNNASGANCSDSGTGTQAQPFCKIQEAVDVVTAGQTVIVEPGRYLESVTITHSGTPTAPITIEGDSAMAPVGIGGGADDLTVSGASDIVISGMDLGSATGDAALIDNAHDVTFSDNRLNYGSGGYGTQKIHVADGSTGIDITKNIVEAVTGTPIVIDGGGSGDVVSTNLIELSEGKGISVDSVSGVAITSNTVDMSCDSGISLTGSSTGATIENNIVARVAPSSGTSLTCSTPATPPRGIVVDAGSVADTVENYNDVDTGSASIPDYQWSGADYSTAADLNTKTGQAATDSNALTIGTDIFDSEPLENSPAVDSANASAPGEQTTDVVGSSRVDDPLVANTGTGSSAYYDRGAVERHDDVTYTNFPQVLSPAGNPTNRAPTGVPLTFTFPKATSSWGGTLTYNYDFGDGTSRVPSSANTITHPFAAAGHYAQYIQVTSSYGGQTGCSCTSLDVVAGAPNPVLKVTRTGDMSVSVDASQSTDPWQVFGAEIDFGDGTSAPTDLTSPVSRTYNYAGKFTIKLTLNDSDQTGAQTTASYTTNGSDFTAYGPTRVLDTRKGIGTGGVIAPVGPGKSIQVPIGGTGAIPADATAVALNVTETGPTAGGYIAAYPAGGTVPATSNLNYARGQTKAANVIVSLGTGGAVTLANTSSGSVQLIADVTGYFSKSFTSGYLPITPMRILDTRKGTGLAGGTPAKVGPGKTIAVDTGRPGASAVVLNLTATNTAGGGYITAYPDGTTAPVASSLNYAPGTTIANTVIVPVSDHGIVDLYNGSSGTVDLVADVEGYFIPNGPEAFVPITPTRLYDSRLSTPLPGAGTVTLTPSAIDAQVPGSAAAYVYNVTVTQPATGGYLTVYPAGQARPTASNVNFAAEETTSNTAIATAGTGGSGAGANVFYNGTGSTLQLVTDLFGYFTSN